MKFNDYQAQAINTAIYPKDKALEYLVPAIGEEVGELLKLFAKTVRDNGGSYRDVDRDKAIKEAGDLLWMLSAMCSELGISLNDVAQANIVKLQSRQRRGVLNGSGDNR